MLAPYCLNAYRVASSQHPEEIQHTFCEMCGGPSDEMDHRLAKFLVACSLDWHSANHHCAFTRNAWHRDIKIEGSRATCRNCKRTIIGCECPLKPSQQRGLARVGGINRRFVLKSTKPAPQNRRSAPEFSPKVSPSASRRRIGHAASVWEREGLKITSYFRQAIPAHRGSAGPRRVPCLSALRLLQNRARPEQSKPPTHRRTRRLSLASHQSRPASRPHPSHTADTPA